MKNLEISVLLDYYASLLPQKQREITELYYNEDFSLSEIAQNQGITRQGARDAIKRAENSLVSLEDKLGLARRIQDISRRMEELENCLAGIKREVLDEQSRLRCDKATAIVESIKESL